MSEPNQILDLIGRRVLVSYVSYGGHISEAFVLEISPSRFYVRLQNEHGTKLWKPVKNVTVHEVLPSVSRKKTTIEDVVISERCSPASSAFEYKTPLVQRTTEGGIPVDLDYVKIRRTCLEAFCIFIATSKQVQIAYNKGDLSARLMGMWTQELKMCQTGLTQIG